MAKQKSNAPKNAPKPTPQYIREKTEKGADTPSIFDGYVPILAVLTLTFFAFLPTFQSEFVNWDDDINITKNRFIHDWTFDNIRHIFSSTVIGNYNPLSILSFAIERAIFGVENLSLVVHTNNLLLHLINVFLVWRIVGEMGFTKWSAFGVALLFGIHPMRVESVAWATERKDVLFSAFYFAALLQYIKYLKSNNYGFLNRYLLAAFGLFILALFSKVQAVSLPLSMLALDYYFRRPLNFKLILEKTHFFIGSLIYGSATIMTLKNANTIADDQTLYTFFERIIIGFHSYAVYVGKFIFPWVMSPLYPYPATIPATFYLTALLFVASVVGIFWAYRRGMTLLVFGWVFFFVNFIFLAQIVGAGQGFLADRFTYVPYFGFFILLAAYTEGSLFSTVKDYTFKINGIETVTDATLDIKNIVRHAPSSTVKYGFMALCVVFFYMTFQQTKVWQNGDTLWSKALEYDDSAATAWQNRGLYFREAKDFKRALGNLDTAIIIRPKSAECHNSRGKTYIDLNNPVEALADFTVAVREKPSLAEAWANRGNAYGQLGKLDSALVDITEALRLDSTLASAYLGRGNVYGILGRFEESVRDLTKALDIEPNNVDVLLNRSITFRDMKQLDKALIDNMSYLALKKDNPGMWLNNGLLKSGLGKYAEALPDFDEAIRLNGLEGGFYLERARCYQKLGNLAAMRADVQTAKGRGVQNIEAALLQ